MNQTFARVPVPSMWMSPPPSWMRWWQAMHSAIALARSVRPPSLAHLRPRTDADCETVADWIDDAEALYLFTGPRLPWPLDPARLARMDQIDGVSAWTLVEDATGRIVGHFDLTVQDDLARLGRVIIDPELRGRGMARTLVGFAIAEARKLGATTLTLNVIAGNRPAIRTYERAGFRSVEPTMDVEVYAMTRSLQR